jgi:hypothetical protein
MKEKKPCRDAQGRYYWLKVYFMEEGDAKAVNSIDHEEETSPNLFHIARFKTSNRNINTGTAAFSPQFSGFQ